MEHNEQTIQEEALLENQPKTQAAQSKPNPLAANIVLIILAVIGVTIVAMVVYGVFIIEFLTKQT